MEARKKENEGRFAVGTALADIKVTKLLFQ
jgi:hypothetical protein